MTSSEKTEEIKNDNTSSEKTEEIKNDNPTSDSNTNENQNIEEKHDVNVDNVNLDGELNKSGSDMEVHITTYPLKIIFIGNSNVGKTSIINRYIKNQFDATHPTISVAFEKKKLKIDPFTEADLNIWDTAGQEKYRSITKNYLRDSNGIVIVFDLTNESSFNDVDSWLQVIDSVVNDSKVAKILIGNKSDLSEPIISYEMASKYAEEHNLIFKAVSAKEGINIEIVFEILAKECVKNIIENQGETEEENLKKESKVLLNDPSKINLDPKSEKSNKCC